MTHLPLKKRYSYTLFVLIMIIALLIPNSEALAYTETYKATGWQSLTQDNLETARLAALDDALQKAVSLAVMAHRPEALTGPKAQVLMADVLARRNELIESYRVVSEEATQARYRVTVTADVRIDQLSALLKAPDVSRPPQTPTQREKIVVFIHENQFEQGTHAISANSIGAILADHLRQAGFTIVLHNTPPTAFALTEVFMQTPLFARQAMAMGRAQQADKVLMGIAKVDGTHGRLSATLFDSAKGEAVAAVSSDANEADTAALRLKLGTDAAHLVLESIRSTPSQPDLTVDLGILVRVTTTRNLKGLIELRRALRGLAGVSQVQPIEMTNETTILSVLGSISTQRLSREISRLPMVASVDPALQGPGGNQITVVLSRY